MRESDQQSQSKPDHPHFKEHLSSYTKLSSSKCQLLVQNPTNPTLSTSFLTCVLPVAVGTQSDRRMLFFNSMYSIY